MVTLKSFILLFLCWSFVIGVRGQIPIRGNGLSFSQQPKSYFDFLNEASRKIKLAKLKDDERTTQTLTRVVSAMRRFYNPLIQNIADGYSISHGLEASNSGQFHAGYKKDALHNLHTEYHSFRDRLNLSSTCINDTGRLVANLVELNHWAVKFFDASGKPGPALLKFRYGFVGDYEECKSARALPTTDGNKSRDSFDGNYCVISFLTEIPNLVVSLGACLPSTCSPGEISNLMYDIIGYVKLRPPIVGAFTQCLTSKTEVTIATVFAILILSLIGVFMFLGTIYDIMTKEGVSTIPDQPDSLSRSRSIRHNSSYESISSIVDKEWNRTPTNGEHSSSFFDRSRNTTMPFDSDEKGALAKIILSFSVYTNAKKILNTSQSAGSLSAIHGIRFLSMSWVLLGHLYMNINFYATNSLDEQAKLLKRWTFLPIVNALVSVDTFFTLSGLLTSYLTIQEMSKRNTWKINWPKFYFHRFWRLTPPYMFSLVIFLGLQQYLGKGPLWFNQQPFDKENCENNWWTNLLYVNNLVKYKAECFGHTWYLANDMQFFILSPLMLIPFYYSRISGILSCLLFLLISWITTGNLSTSHKWPTTPLSLKPVPGRATEEEWMADYYVVPWCRIGPFIVGVISGYALALTKGNQFRMHWLLVGVGWISAVASGLAIVYGLRGDISGDSPSSVTTASFYNAVSRTVWGGCVCWVIIACSAGYGGPVNALLSWSPFVVLGRLTYMTYLIHLNLLAVFFGNFGAFYFANDSMMVVFYLGLLVFVNLVAFVCVLALESPMVGLEKAFIRKEKRDG